MDLTVFILCSLAFLFTVVGFFVVIADAKEPLFFTVDTLYLRYMINLIGVAVVARKTKIPIKKLYRWQNGEVRLSRGAITKIESVVKEYNKGCL